MAIRIRPFGLLVLVSLTFTAHAAEIPDPNSRGFGFYKKGKYAEALPLFEKAIATEAKSPYPWLNHARTLALLDAKIEDECAFETNWKYVALWDLSRAFEIDSAKLFAKLRDDDPGNAALKKLPEFAAWWLAVQPLPNAVGLKSFLAAHPEWAYREPAAIVITITLAPEGKVRVSEVPMPAGFASPTAWKVDGTNVKLTMAGKPVSFELKRREWFFDEGRKKFFFLGLEKAGDQDVKPGSLELGPVLHDCS